MIIDEHHETAYHIVKRDIEDLKDHQPKTMSQLMRRVWRTKVLFFSKMGRRGKEKEKEEEEESKKLFFFFFFLLRWVLFKIAHFSSFLNIFQ